MNDSFLYSYRVILLNVCKKKVKQEQKERVHLAWPEKLGSIIRLPRVIHSLEINKMKLTGYVILSKAS